MKWIYCCQILQILLRTVFLSQFWPHDHCHFWLFLTEVWTTLSVLLQLHPMYDPCIFLCMVHVPTFDLNWFDIYGKCRQKFPYHTWILWLCSISHHICNIQIPPAGTMVFPQNWPIKKVWVVSQWCLSLFAQDPRNKYISIILSWICFFPVILFSDCNMVNHHRSTFWENIQFFQASCANPSSFALFCWIVWQFRSGVSF